jgi:hypothetical protein
MEFHGFDMDLAWIFIVVALILHVFGPDFARIWHGFCMDVAWIWHGFCIDFARVLIDFPLPLPLSKPENTHKHTETHTETHRNTQKHTAEDGSIWLQVEPRRSQGRGGGVCILSDPQVYRPP